MFLGGMEMLKGYTGQSRSEEIMENRRRLLQIWSSRPAATDTMENIARKWLGQFEFECVREALLRLIQEGIIQKCCSGGHTFFYARDYYEIKQQVPQK